MRDFPDLDNPAYCTECGRDEAGRKYVSIIVNMRCSVRLAVSLWNPGQAKLSRTLISSISGRERLRPKRPGVASAHADHAILEELFRAGRRYQELASRHGIQDIFQDNGGKLLQTLLIQDMTLTEPREENDARDRLGNEYKFKSVNVDPTKSFSTHHHLDPVILAKYRGWPAGISPSIKGSN